MRFALGLRRGIGWMGLVVALAAAPAHGADLMDVYNMALDSDAGIQSARYALEAAKEKVPEAISALLPAIGASATDGHTLGNTQYSGTPQVQRGFSSYTWTVQLTQPLLHAQSVAVYDESRAIAEQATAQYRLAQEDLILRVSQAYFDIQVANEALAAADAQLKSTEEQLTAAQRGYDDGTVAITDVHEARAHAEQARSQRVAALDDLETRRAALEAIIGRVPEALASLKELVVAPRPDPERVESWVAQAKSENPAVRAAIAAVNVAQAEVYKAEFQRLPTIDLVASIGRNYSSGNIINPSDYATNASDRQIGVQVSMPILDGGGIHAMVREAKANERKAEADLEAARRKSAADARDAYAGIVNGLAQIQALEVAVKSGESSVTGNQVGYRLGIRINSDVLNAQQQLFSSARDLAKARYDTLLQGLKLKAAAGSLGEKDILVVNALLSNDGGPSPAAAVQNYREQDRTAKGLFKLDQHIEIPDKS